MDGRDDEHVRRLQRIAYGANASAEERSAALDELDRLGRFETASVDDASAAATPDPAHGVEPEAAVDGAGPEAAVDGRATPVPRRSRRFTVRAGVIAGAVALVFGVAAGFAVGWQSRPGDLGGTTTLAGSSGPVELGPRLHADVFASMPIALETDAARVFEREPTPADALDLETPLTELTALLAPVDTRLLATSPNGVTLFAARDDTDLCLVADFGDGGAASVCTQRGRFPTDGLRMTAGAPGIVVEVAWTPDGVVHLATPH
ncbi:hypothetical protein [Agromyces neolithicus]|uniref:DUF1707 domain-containing protein n=1 Tax=Agromyces neolithicus TaxID=269420 RepID=A0ABN2M4T1_9MICO